MASKKRDPEVKIERIGHVHRRPARTSRMTLQSIKVEMRKALLRKQVKDNQKRR